MIPIRRHCNIVELLHKSHDAPVPYLTMLHFVTEMCTFLSQNGTLRDSWDWSIRLSYLLSVRGSPQTMRKWLRPPEVWAFVSATPKVATSEMRYASIKITCTIDLKKKIHCRKPLIDLKQHNKVGISVDINDNISSSLQFLCVVLRLQCLEVLYY